MVADGVESGGGSGGRREECVYLCVGGGGVEESGAKRGGNEVEEGVDLWRKWGASSVGEVLFMGAGGLRLGEICEGPGRPFCGG